MTPDLAAVQAALGHPLRDPVPLSGGDICQAWRLEGPDGPVFLKTHGRPPPGLFAAEAEGLAALAAAAPGLVVPRVLGHGSGWLALGWLAAGTSREAPQRLGEGLAALHRDCGDRHGAAMDNYIGTLPQQNRLHRSWVACWREDRLEPQATRAARALGPSLTRRLGRLLERLDGLLPHDPPASQLHGDLWGGNWMDTAAGPAVYDPAAYRGDREVDLAMMALFGGFPARTWQAYEGAWPLPPGAQERRPLYQLYPLLVHVNLFGGGYLGQVDGVVRRYA